MTCRLPACLLMCMLACFSAPGYTLLHYAVEGGDLAIVQQLLAAMVAEPPKQEQEQQDTQPKVQGAATVPTRGDLAAGAASTCTLYSPLHLAAQKGHYQLLQPLLEAGYPPDTKSPDQVSMWCHRMRINGAALPSSCLD